MAFTITNNSPSAGYIAWANLNMQYEGVTYAITNGNTNKIYTYWTPSTPNTLVSTDTFPTLGADDCLLFLNKTGTAVVVPTATIIPGDLIVPGSILANAIAANTITSAQIASGAITTTELAAGAVTTTALAAGAVTATAIAANAIGASAIAADAIISTKIAADAIGTNHIAAGAITSNEIATGAITANAVAANAIGATAIAADAIVTSKLAAGAVTVDKLDVRAQNLVNNITTTGVFTGWTIGKQDAANTYSLATDTTRGRVIQSDAKTAPNTFDSDYFIVDPNQTYKINIGLLLTANATGGRQYFGVNCYDENNVNVGAYTFDIATQVFGALSTNPYFWNDITTDANWRDMEAYLISANVTDVKDVPDGKNVTTHFRMHPKTRKVKIRFYNGYYPTVTTGVTSTAYWYSPSVQSVDSGKITASRIVAGTITATEIAADTITGAKIAADTITASEIAVGTITATEIASSTITGTKIAANTIATGNLAAGSITTTELAANAVTAAKIAVGTITANELAANTITAAKIAAGTITATEIASTTITGSKLVNSTITATQIADSTITGAKIVDATLTGAKIAANTITTEKLTVMDMTNLVSGSDFEDATKVPFTLHATHTIATDNFKSGTKSLKLAATATAATSTLKYKPRVNSGEKLYVEYWVLTTADYNGIAGNSKLRIGDSANTYIGELTFGGATYTTWTKRTNVITVTTGTELTIAITNDGTVGTVWIDDIIIRRMATAELIVDGTITGTKIAADTISTSNLAAGAVTTNELAANAVTAAKIAANTITASQIAADTITGTQIAANAISTTELAANAVTAAKIAAGTITSNEIAANTITASDIAAGTITATEIAGTTITGTKIAANTISTGNLAAGVITTNELAAGAVTAAKITAGTITATEIANTTITGSKMVNGTITATQISDSTITNAKIVDATLTGAKIAASTITSANIAITSPNLMDYGWDNFEQLKGSLNTSASGSQGNMTSIDVVDSATTDAYVGSKCLKVVNSAVANSYKYLGNTNKIAPAKAGERYILSAYVKTASATAHDVQLTIVARDSANTSMGTSSTTKNIITGDGWVRIWIAYTMPANTTQVTGYLRIPAATSYTTYWDAFQLERAEQNTAETEPSAWRPVGTTSILGDNIKTGTIDASLVNVTNINASNIESGTINAIAITGSTITGGTLSGATITSSNPSNASNSYTTIQNQTIRSVLNNPSISTLKEVKVEDGVLTVSNTASGTVRKAVIEDDTIVLNTPTSNNMLTPTDLIINSPGGTFTIDFDGATGGTGITANSTSSASTTSLLKLQNTSGYAQLQFGGSTPFTGLISTHTIVIDAGAGDIELYAGSGKMVKAMDRLSATAGLDVTGAITATGDITANDATLSGNLDVTGTTTLGGYTIIESAGLNFSNTALISNDGGAVDVTTGTNVDHIWHDDTNNAWNFVSDGTYKVAGNSKLVAGSLDVSSGADLGGQLAITRTGSQAITLVQTDSASGMYNYIGFADNAGVWQAFIGYSSSRDGKFKINNTKQGDIVLEPKTGSIVSTTTDLSVGGMLLNEDIIAPTLTNAWVNYGGSFQTAGYWKDKNGVVHLTGLIKSGTVGSAAFTLPGGTAEVESLTISASATASGNVTVTLNGTATNVAVVAGDTASGVATKIRAATFTGWTTGGTGATVTFTKTMGGENTAPVYSAGSTGATGTISTTTKGKAGYRPDATQIYMVLSNNAVGRVDINSSGNVTPASPATNTWVSLDGISFKAVA